MLINYRKSAILIVGMLALGAQGFVVPSAFRRSTMTLCVLSEPTQGEATTTATNKKIEQANLRIGQLDLLVEQADEKIEKLDQRMQLVGDDDELFDLQKQKERIEKEISKYMKDWDKLEDTLDRLHPMD